MPKKLKWFLSAVGFAMIAYGAYTYQAYDPMKACIGVAAICLIVWLYKVIRDIRLIKSPPPVQEQSSARDSANRRLSVPPPLDK